MAFFPLRPAVRGHTLVIPRRHIADIWAADRDTAHDVSDAVLLVASAIRQAVRPAGLNVITSAGAVAEQTVLHWHVHVLPRFPGDGFGPIWRSDQSQHAAGDLDDTAAKIRDAIFSAPTLRRSDQC